MIQSNVFNYINVLDKAADAAWLRNDVISNNIANVNTPGYKRKDVAFEGELTRALSKMRYKSMDEKVDHLTLGDIRPTTYTDHGDFSYRVDKNNVDIDTENVELARNQIKYNALITGVNQEFANLKTVTK